MPARRKATGPGGTMAAPPSGCLLGTGRIRGRVPRSERAPTWVRGAGEGARCGDAGTEGQVGRLGCGGGERTGGRGPGVAVDRLAAGRGGGKGSAAAGLYGGAGGGP